MRSELSIPANCLLLIAILAVSFTLVVGSIVISSDSGQDSLQNEKMRSANDNIVVAKNQSVIFHRNNLLQQNIKLIRTPETCGNQTFELIIAIKSMPEKWERRATIRETWGNVNAIENYPVKRIFLMGKQTNIGYNVSAEHEINKDILQGDFEESFNNLTYKDFIFLNWIKRENCHSKFIFKGDDDILLNTFLLKGLLDRYQDYIKRPMIVGSVLRNSPRVDDPESKYFVSDAEYKPSFYPPYVSGGGFIMTQPLAQILLERMKLKSSLPTFPIDDAFLGQLLSEAGLTSSIRNNRGFKSWGLADVGPDGRKADGEDGICKVLQVYTLHNIGPKDMKRLWNEMTNVAELVDKCQFKQIPDELLMLRR